MRSTTQKNTAQKTIKTFDLLTGDTQIRFIRQNNKLLRKLHTGESVNIGTEQNSDSISLKKLIANFNFFILKQYPIMVIQDMWNNQSLRQAYCGETSDLSDDTLISHFKSILTHKNETLILDMWNSKRLKGVIQNASSGQHQEILDKVKKCNNISFMTIYAEWLKTCKNYDKANEILESIQDRKKISSEYQKTHFIKQAQKRKEPTQIVFESDDYKKYNNKNNNKRQKINGQENRGDQQPSVKIPEQDKIVIQDNRLSKDLFNLLEANLFNEGASDDIKTNWAWYCGQPINFRTDDDPDWRIIPLDELVSSFEAVLYSHREKLIIEMWNKNPLLRAWYSGQPVNFGTDDDPTWRTISMDEAVSHFKLVLSSKVSYVIEAMHKDGNPYLWKWFSGQAYNFRTQESQEYNADIDQNNPDLQGISDDNLINHFNSVVSSENRYILKAMWDGNQRLHRVIDALSLYHFNQEPDLALLNSKSVIEKVTDSMDNHQRNVSDLNTQYLDACKKYNEQKKKAIIESVVSQLPTEINGIYIAGVDQKLAEILLSEKIQNMMGISRIRKNTHQSDYMIYIDDREKYYNYLLQHSSNQSQKEAINKIIQIKTQGLNSTNKSIEKKIPEKYFSNSTHSNNAPVETGRFVTNNTNSIITKIPTHQTKPDEKSRELIKPIPAAPSKSDLVTNDSQTGQSKIPSQATQNNNMIIENLLQDVPAFTKSPFSIFASNSSQQHQNHNLMDINQNQENENCWENNYLYGFK